MHRATFIAFLVFMGMAIALPMASACGSKSTQEATGSCCSSAEKAFEDTCENTCAQQHPGQDCPTDGGCDGCHCPGCGTTYYLPFAPCLFTSEPSIAHLCDGELKRQAFYFSDHLPEEVYRAIWQPPQLAA